MNAPDGTDTAVWCDRCGEPLTTAAPPGPAPHAACAAARELEPPRFCPRCRRRMKVQVLPKGWSATCVEHGTTSS
ncbi:hypothetical protein ACFPIJ_19560 [Dactylosporangium cerinum]|uniref:Biotin synthase auxiliary protein n=1 Tax=Dactylosporangium cerinum TaxID=1434730 RepID=A0ABV9VVC0_9ACTN